MKNKLLTITSRAIFCLAALITLDACTDNTEIAPEPGHEYGINRPKNPINPIVLAALTGEELFRGIFYGQGVVASIIPEIQHNTYDWADTDEEKAQIKTMQDSIIYLIRERNPLFFDEFKTGIQSGNHHIVKLTMISAGENVIEAVNSMVEGNNSPTEQKKATFKLAKAVDSVIDGRSYMTSSDTSTTAVT